MTVGELVGLAVRKDVRFKGRRAADLLMLIRWLQDACLGI